MERVQDTQWKIESKCAIGYIYVREVTMPLVVYVSKKGERFHKDIKDRIVEVNSLPNVDQKLECFVDDHTCILSLTASN